jgi:hypothetical protein
MATTLRELIAKVVFRADPAKIKDFDAKLDGLKAKLTGVDVNTTELSATLAKATERFLGLRVALQDVNGKLDPAQVEAYSEAFKGAEARATQVRQAIERLRLVDPKNKELPALEKQLSEVERESREAAKALEKVGVSLKQVKPDAGGKAGGGLGGLSKLLGGLTAAAAAYKVISWGKQLTDEARAVGDLAARLAIGTDELQAWTALAEDVGASTEDLTGSVKTLANNIIAAGDAADGPAASAFKKLGISTAGWKNHMPGTMDVLLAAGGALDSLESDTERLAVAQQLLGESGLKLLPAFKGGTEAAREQLDELRELAIVYGEDFIAASKETDKEMRKLEWSLKAVGVQILAGVLPPLRGFVRWLTPVIKGVRELTKNSNILTVTLGVLGYVGIGKLFARVGKLITRFGGLGNVLKAARRILLQFILPMLVLDDLLSFLKGEGSVIGDILDAMLGAGAAQKAAEGLRDSWQALIGVVKYFWGLLTGDEAAVDAGEALILKFGGFVDEVFNAIGAKLSEWGGLFVEAAEIALADAKALLLGWANEISTYFGGLWTRIVEGLAQMLSDAVSKLKGLASHLPLIGGLFSDHDEAPEAPAARVADNARNALALGGTPTASSSKSSTVTVNDHSSITTNLNGVDAKNVGPALRQSERNIQAELTRNRAQVLRQTVGAAGA